MKVKRQSTKWEKIFANPVSNKGLVSIICKELLFCCLVTESHPALLWPHGLQVTGSSVHGIFQARILEWVAISFSRVFFLTQELNPHLLHWQADSLPLSHLGSPKELLQLSNKNNSIKKFEIQRIWINVSPKKIYKLPVRTQKICSIS